MCLNVIKRKVDFSFFLLTTGILITKSILLTPHRYCESKKQFPHIDWLPMFYKTRIVLVITRCGKRKQNVSFLVWCARVAVCSRLLVVCGHLLVACSRLLIVCGCLLVLCGRLLVVCGSLWSFAGWLCLFVLVCGSLFVLVCGSLLSFLIVACFSNYVLVSYGIPITCSSVLL